jgi:hypothetical protein
MIESHVTTPSDEGKRNWYVALAGGIARATRLTVRDLSGLERDAAESVGESIVTGRPGRF